MTTIITESGREKTLPAGFNPERVEGLDPDGRIVVDDFGARNEKPNTVVLNQVVGEPGPPASATPPFMFALTLCCNAYDKGVEDGIVCRACYSYEETGDYLYRAPDGTFPGLDPIAGVRP